MRFWVASHSHWENSWESIIYKHCTFWAGMFLFDGLFNMFGIGIGGLIIFPL